MTLRLRLVLDGIRGGLWFIPAGCILVAAIAGWAVLQVDRAAPVERAEFYIFSGGPESARAVLSTISGGLISVIALTFSVTMLVLQLLDQARHTATVIHLRFMVGDFVGEDAPLFEIWGTRAQELEQDDLVATVAIGAERTMGQDASFGFRQLADIAEKALSPAINDPTTAVQALDQCHALLRFLVKQQIPTPCRADDRGQLRLILPRPDWDTYVHVTVDEVRQYGQTSIQIARRLRYLLEDLYQCSNAEQQSVLKEEMSLLDRAVERGFPDVEDRALAAHPSPQGHGADDDDNDGD